MEGIVLSAWAALEKMVWHAEPSQCGNVLFDPQLLDQINNHQA